MTVKVNTFGLNKTLHVISNVLKEAERVTDSETKNLNIRYALGAIDALNYIFEIADEDEETEFAEKLNEWAFKEKK